MTRWGAATLAVAAMAAVGCDDGADDPPTAAPESASSRPAAVDDAASTSTGQSTAAPFHPAGIGLQLPPGWEERDGAVVATEFAMAGRCRSVLVVDFEPPAGPAGQSGGAEEGAAHTLQSVVQVCAQPTDGRDLETFMRDTYGDVAAFERTSVDGRDGYREIGRPDPLVFTQTAACLVQIATAVDAAPELEARRRQEVGSVLDSLVLEDRAGGCA